MYVKANDIRREDLNDNGRKLIVNITKISIEGLIKKSSEAVRIL